jgi:integrase
MVEHGYCRRYVNDHIGRLRRIFKWGVGEELIPPTVYQALTAVPGLRRGRTEAPEAPPVLPVDDATVEATLSHLPAVIADMAKIQRLTGARPSEVCVMRPCDVDTSGEPWIYRPMTHKTEHRGRERVIAIGPRAQDVLRPYLLRQKDSYCFAPAESEQKRRRTLHERRVTPLSYGNRPGTNRKRRPKRLAGERYTTHSYRRAIHRVCNVVGIPLWSPNRLRHTAATEIRRRFGVEAAQVTLGHAKADVTQVYAERDMALAARVMQEVG